tara:strand:- start:397 stop:1326 length:930 start_codon:yes stop_codon:yes gene_type:complete
MKIKFFKLLIIIYFIFYPEILVSKVGNNIILKIENEIITNFEIKNKIMTSLILVNQEINQTNINNFKKQALDSLIQLKLKKIELSKYNFKNDNTQINNYLKNILRNDIDGFKNNLKKNNLSYELFLDEIETQLKWQKLIYQIYSKKIEVNEESVDKEIEDIIKKQKDIEEFKISEIEVLSNNDQTDEELIIKVQEQIKNEGFEETALKISTSSTSSNKGSLGWINGKSLSTSIYTLMSKLEIGEMSKPIKGQGNILFLKLNDKRTSKSMDIDRLKLKQNLIDQKKNELFNLYSRSHLSKLKNTSLIEYK